MVHKAMLHRTYRALMCPKVLTALSLLTLTLLTIRAYFHLLQFDYQLVSRDFGKLKSRVTSVLSSSSVRSDRPGLSDDMGLIIDSPKDYRRSRFSLEYRGYTDAFPSDITYWSWRFDTTLRYWIGYSLMKDLLFRASRKISNLAELFGEENNEGQILKTYDYDPRLSTTVYYGYISSRLSDGAKLEDIAVPFSWYDWVDMSILNEFIELPLSKKPTSGWVVNKFLPVEQLLEFESAFGHELFTYDREHALSQDYFISNTKLLHGDTGTVSESNLKKGAICVDSKSPFMPGFECSAVYEEARPEVWRFQTRSKLYSYGPKPISMVFLNKEGPALQVSISDDPLISSNNKKPANLLFNGMLEEHLKKNVQKYPKLPKKDLFFDNIREFEELLKEASSAGVDLTDMELPFYKNLTGDMFEFDAVKRLEELKATPNLSEQQKHYMESLEYSLNTHYAYLDKFFKEAGNCRDYVHLGHHFDAKFFNGAIEPHEVRSALDAMVRAWLAFTNNNNVTSWLSHGTLYAWMYNGMAFPWDGDHDMQMPIAELNRLAEHYNQSIIVEDPRVGNGRYFLDVTSSITSRIHGNNKNNIDARFIDVNTGLYIDITGLSVNNEGVKDRLAWLVHKFRVEHEKDAVKFKDPNAIANVNDMPPLALIDIEKAKNGGKISEDRLKYLKNLDKDIYEAGGNFKHIPAEDRYSINKHIQVYTCRNKHSTALWELAPLRLTYFHGAQAYVPNLILKLLRAEYAVKDGYIFAEYKDHKFLPAIRSWITDKDVSVALNSDGKSVFADYKIPASRISVMPKNDLDKFMHNFASDPRLLDSFATLWNSYDITRFRKKEIELTYERLQPLVSDKRLEFFLQGPMLNPIYKDSFQWKMETQIFKDIVDRNALSFGLGDVFAWNRRLAQWMLEENEAADEKQSKWYMQDDRWRDHRIDYSKMGRFFYSTGDLNDNDIFRGDPVPKGTSLNRMYHMHEENRFRTIVEAEKKKSEEHQRLRNEAIKKEEERLKNEEERLKNEAMKKEEERLKKEQERLQNEAIKKEQERLKNEEERLKNEAMKKEEERLKKEQERLQNEAIKKEQEGH
ncbi:HFL275Wp [Eremothecium sinecaudum]|uniref:HFL275Wp n=1 Tax=Eremothecium sinecaudum TaxID=45286 RepID=A0A0X8HTK8_9SACH|nr:HFL275Wp [Eremothecium sinecaudum]AMD21581.1 HFL275Wp [Eremothecium sinecaudum]